MMRTWKLALLIGGLAAAAVFAAATIAFGADGPGRGMPLGGTMMAVAGDNDAGEGGLRGCGGFGLLQDPQAREDMQTLREEHRDEMRAWLDTYGEDRSSDAAQKALDELRTEHADDMRALFEKYGVEPPAGLGEGGRGGSGFGGACGGSGGQGCGGQGWNGGQGMMGGSGGWNGSSL
jgi:hypothetical protein